MYAFTTLTGPVTYDQTQHQFSPKTPSALRTSRNANLMPPPSPLDTRSSPLVPCATTQQPFSLNPAPQLRRASTPSVFPNFSTFPTSISTTPDATSSTFASRSRASTPTAILTAHTAAAKDRRKSLFRDKIRQQRDDARFEGRGDQVLRMDFVKERRAWEERLMRRAPAAAAAAGAEADGDDDESMEGVNEFGIDGNGMVPWTEEEEIEALAQYLVDREDVGEDQEMRLSDVGDGMVGWQEQQGQGRRLDHDQGIRVDSSGSYGSDEEDYDQLFMEVISGSQEQADPGQWPTQQRQWGQHSGLDGDQNQPSSSMDLS